MADDLAAVVMAGGLGTRMKSATPKHLHPLLGRRMVDWVIAAARDAGVARIVVVASPDSAGSYDDLEVAVQEAALGTGDAVRAARAALEGADGDVLVLNGAVPALTAGTVLALVDTHRRAAAAATVLSFEPADARAYGRIVRDTDGRLARIVEAADATEDELALGEVNSGIYVFRGAALWPVLDRLEPHNAQGELYVTDTLGLLAGVTIVDPASTWIDAGIEIEPDVTIHPFSVLRGPIRIAAGAEIGPFAYVRPGTVVGEGAKIGTFVEVKASTIGARTKVPHLSYIGDADIGEDTNIAAGNITANYPHEPGQPKGKTRIGSNVRTGVDNTFDAPVDVGDDAWIAAGGGISDDVPPGSLAGFAPRQETKEGWVYDRHGKRDRD